MSDLILTEQEQNIILQLRKDDEERNKARENLLHILDTTYKYSKWLIENGAGSTFSTFCDDFGYEAKQNGLDRKTIYEKILSIRDIARSAF